MREQGDAPVLTSADLMSGHTQTHAPKRKYMRMGDRPPFGLQPLVGIINLGFQAMRMYYENPIKHGCERSYRIGYLITPPGMIDIVRIHRIYEFLNYLQHIITFAECIPWINARTKAMIQCWKEV